MGKGNNTKFRIGVQLNAVTSKSKRVPILWPSGVDPGSHDDSRKALHT